MHSTNLLTYLLTYYYLYCYKYMYNNHSRHEGTDLKHSKTAIY